MNKLPNCRCSLLVLPLALLMIMGCGEKGTDNPSSGTGNPTSVLSDTSPSVMPSGSSQISSAGQVCALNGQPLLLDNDASAIRLEAEDFDGCAASFSDADPQLGDSDYREEMVDVSADSAASGGVYVSHMLPSEYIEYSLSVTRAGLYNLDFRMQDAAETSSNSSELAHIVVSIDGKATGEFSTNTKQWKLYSLKNAYFSGGHHTLRVMIANTTSERSGKTVGVGLDFIEFRSQEDNTSSPVEIVKAMGTGINLGNTLDVPAGLDWGAQLEAEDYFSEFKAAGFEHVRIPVTWGGRTEESPPYAVNAQWMARVEKTVDWALAQGFYVILNAHHERWLKESYTDQDLDRIDAIWAQVAQRFRYKPHRLLFEILNEPEGMTVAQVDLANERLLKTMRKTNPTRPVVFSGNGFTPYATLLKAAIPDDPYLIGNYHNYDPWSFAGQCVTGWGSADDYSALRAIYQAVADWSNTHNIPVTVNEFGVAVYDWEKPDNVCSPTDRLRYLKAHVELQKEMDIPGTVWDDDGAFRIYDRAKRQWGPSLESLIFD